MGSTGRQTAEGGTGDLAGPRFSEEDLVRTAAAVLGALGAPEQTAQLVATSLVLSNLVGHDSHGIVRLIQYSDWVRTGQIPVSYTHLDVYKRQGRCWFRG